ncbi:MAG: Nif3-like dinuclear metal center hexameric protein [Phycisphaerales bacterium]|nr:Nif3-like dinuclear metal center hexameric protein [Phycisphaerales bacterium]
MTAVSDLCLAMESIAPAAHAADWDNVGLLVGRRDAPAANIMLTIDLTSEVLAEAVTAGVDAIVSYHPPIFSPLKRLDDSTETGRLMLGLIGAGIAVYSPHTALDAAPGGMTDWLASGLGDGEARPLEHAHEHPPGEANKIVTYVPGEHIDAVRDAMAAAGAGMIGDYSHCSTAIDNAGTFLGGDSTNPATGQRGALEHVAEKRLMMVCSERALAGAIAALREAHPYEEPPVHVIPLASRPMHDSGMGRVITLAAPVTTADLIGRVKAHLGVDQIRVSGEASASHEVVACCPGAGGSLLGVAQAAGATAFLTGEMRHHDVLAARAAGVTVLLPGHTNSERGFLPILRDRLATALPGGAIIVSSSDESPWSCR